MGIMRRWKKARADKKAQAGRRRRGEELRALAERKASDLELIGRHERKISELKRELSSGKIPDRGWAAERISALEQAIRTIEKRIESY